MGREKLAYGSVPIPQPASVVQPTIGNKSNVPASVGGGANAGWVLLQDSSKDAAWGQVDSAGIAAGAVDEAHLSFSVATQAELDAHVNDTSDAHDASAISVDSTTLVGTGTDVQAVLEELDNGIADHLADTSDAHDASAISYAGSTNLSSTDVEAALDELDSEKASATAVHCCAYRSSALTHTSTGNYTLISLDAEDDDTNSMHDNSTNPSRIVAPTAGVYLITAQARLAASATGIIGIAVLKNNAGATYDGSKSLFATGDDNDSGSGQYASASKTVRLAANDYIEMYGYQNSGGNLAYTVGTTQTWMSLTRIGA